MTPQELENIERQYEKARNAGPQAVEDWAKQHAVALFTSARPAIATDYIQGVADTTRAASEVIDEVMPQIREQLDRLTDTLRPFAALGAPVCLTALEEYRILNDLPDHIPAFAVPDMDGGDKALAFVTAEQCKAAHDLINEIDGGGGA